MKVYLNLNPPFSALSEIFTSVDRLEAGVWSYSFVVITLRFTIWHENGTLIGPILWVK